jgi:hypothetical protein
MPVLYPSGKKVNWNKPPKVNRKMLWSQTTTSGGRVYGSFRTIAHLDRLNILSKKRFGVGIRVIQPPYSRGVRASAGTHDYDACVDLYIPGVPWLDQQGFFRANGFACWWRKPPIFGDHIHGFTLPPREGAYVGDDFRATGLVVGKYVDGGWSRYGRKSYSSQIDDYYQQRTGLSGHYRDESWFPKNISATIFSLEAYIKRRQNRKAS